MTVRQMRELLGMSAQKFGDKYQIPLRTIQNWEGGQRECPVYVQALLERAVIDDYEEENGHIYTYSVESTESDAKYDLHLFETDDLEEGKKMAREFKADGLPVQLVKTLDYLTGFYDDIEF